MFQDVVGLSDCDLGRFGRKITLYPKDHTGAGSGD
jgi:hypothetical protein